MFIIDVTYKSDLSLIDQHLEAHKSFLDTNYQSGYFLASGRKNPRTGGIILTQAVSIEDIHKIIAQDPFKMYDIANYHITEFIPSKTNKALDFLMT
ncbi:hypothetical protein PK35_10360 [Tamlana nanhaiensis]|uniref:YCII-related domain-containing protein n=1 Tax=Neotamlana nanhaiensis TaxID=1382798 RepID=A0A0D7W0R7_9FLAO|nr:YciI family protein [Tamlana nanhaiensis]KJD32634.1 hypothetical protein PK35_10360 [Tamlana nanhaiensis]